MNKRTTHHGPEAAQLRVLLSLSRELFQTDDAAASMCLVGRTLVELLQPASALLLLRNDRLEQFAFDRQGAVHGADSGHALYQAGIKCLCAADVDGQAGLDGQADPRRLVVVATPAHPALAVLAVAWDRDLDGAVRPAYRRILSSMLELMAGALGKIDARTALEQIVADQRAHIARSAAAHAAELVLRDESVAELRLLSLTDVMTGLYNRRGFFVHAERVFKVARRKHSSSAVIFADIDGLKRVNDALGHEAGDALIRDAALVFRQSFRQADVVSRLGGDEFVAYTLDDERPDAILERIRNNLHAFNLMQERAYAVTMSVGVVQCDPFGGKTLADYVLLADERMYVEKRRRLH